MTETNPPPQPPSTPQAMGGEKEWKEWAANEIFCLYAEQKSSATLIETLKEALRFSERTMTYALGVIVEFGDLNGFRNLSNEELGKAVVETARGISASLDKARAALADGGK